MTAAIRTVGLTKRYGSVTAVDGVELDVPPSDIYGFLGPNGSGKTTTVRMLLGLVLPTAGTVEVLGARIPKHARSVLYRVGALVEAPAAYGHLGARANLSIMDAAGPGGSRRTRKARIGEALEQVGLAGVGRRPVKAYSLGMRQRLGIAAALIRKPELLILDEPTNGLDPRGIQEIRELLLDLNQSAGTTIFLSSHLLAEVEHLCRRVGVVDRGRLVLQDSLASLRAPTGSVVLRTPDPEWAVGVLDGDLRERSGDRLVVRAADPAELNARLVGHGIRITELTEERRSLEEVVLAATTASSDRVDAAVPRTMGRRAEVLAGDDSAWDRPPPGPPDAPPHPPHPTGCSRLVAPRPTRAGPPAARAERLRADPTATRPSGSGPLGVGPLGVESVGADGVRWGRAWAVGSAFRGVSVIGVELMKMLRRPRTWVVIALIDALPTLVAFLLALTDVGPRPGTGPAFLSAVLNNGVLFPAAALAIVLPLFLPVSVAIVSGDSIAGEAQAGTLRYLLARPAGRTRLLVAKLVTVLVFVGMTVVVVVVTGYFVGTSLFGTSQLAGGNIVSVSGEPLTAQQAVLRTLLAMAYVAFSMLGVAAMAVFLSTLTDSPLAAAMGALAFLVASSLLLTLDAADSIRPYLPTRYWLAFVDLFRQPILWRDVVRGVGLQAVYVAVLLGAAWANFTTKDIKS